MNAQPAFKIPMTNVAYCIANCLECPDWECRCESCIYLVDEDGEWYCEKYMKLCKDIENCEEYHNE